LTRWTRPLALGLTVLVLVFVAFELYVLMQAHWSGLWRQDRTIYQDGALRWLEQGWFYYPEQLAGPYEIIQGHVLYPPTAMPWLVLGAFLPDPVWFLLPIAVVAAVVAHHRPRMEWWPLLAMCLAHPESRRMLVSGTPTTWIAMFAAIGTVWRPAFALVFLKPSLFPVAFLGCRSRGWWALSIALGVLSLAMLPMWLDYLRALTNGRGVLATPFYSVKDLPLVLLPVVAWLGSRDHRQVLGADRIPRRRRWRQREDEPGAVVERPRAVEVGGGHPHRALAERGAADR
jgi:hypothetical protein